MSMITLKQAADRTGKSELTIRRLVKATIKEREKRPAGLSKIITMRKGSYLVDEAWIDSQYTTADDEDIEPPKQTSHVDGISGDVSSQLLSAKDQTIELLKREIDRMNSQLEAKDTQMKEMNARASEVNVIMARLQDTLRLAAPSEDAATREPSDVEYTTEVQQDTTVIETPQTASEEPTVPKKRGWFRRS